VAYVLLARGPDLDAERRLARVEAEAMGVRSVSFGAERG